MRLVHCRRCFQATPLLTRCCTHCGEIDRFRVVRGFGEMLIYFAGGVLAIGLVVWIARVLS